MSDPVGLIGGAGGAGGVNPPRTPAGGVAPAQDGPSFKDLLMENINEVNKLQQDATRAIEDLQTGDRTDVEGVLVATAKADMAFRLLQQVRNKVMDAYTELQSIRV